MPPFWRNREMNCLHCFNYGRMSDDGMIGCEVCNGIERQAMRRQTINCTHAPNDWRNPCDKCMYRGMRNMTEEEQALHLANQIKFIGCIPALNEDQNKEFSDETLRRLAQGVQDYNAGKIGEREWRKPSLWQRFKEWFRCFLSR